MALAANYTEWLDLLRDWIDVEELSDLQISTCLSLAQIRLNRELDSQWMEATASILVVDGALPIPIIADVPDFNRVRLVVSDQNSVPLDALAINEFQKLVAEAVQGSTSVTQNSRPLFYAIENQALNIFPYPTGGSNIILSYYMQVPELSVSVPTNIFSLYHADALLYGGCLEVSRLIVEDERIPMWEQSYAQALIDSNDTAKNSKMGSTPLKRQITMFASNQ